MKKALVLLLAVAVVAILAEAASAADWKDALQEKLSSGYVLTKTSKLSKERATEPGTVVIARVDGLSSGMPTHVSGGKLRPAGGWIQAALPKEAKRDFRAGERFYVTDIDVNDQDVKVILLSTDASDLSQGGTTYQKHWLLAVQFEYPKNFLRTAEPSQIRADIDAIIPTEAQAKAIQTKVVEIGQTPIQVEAIFGKPESIVKLGPKIIYNYKSLKVTFVDGQVADAQ